MSQQQRQMMDAYEDATKLVTGSSHLQIPEGFKLFEIASNGISHLDFLPYVTTTHPKLGAGAWTWYRSYNVHRNMGLDGRTSVVCPRELGQPCPICEAGSRLARLHGTQNKEIEKALKGLEAKQRTLFVVYDLMNPGEGIQIFDVSHYLFTKQLGQRIAKASLTDPVEQNWRYFSDPENGLSVKINWQEEGFDGRKFWKTSSIDFRTRTDQYDGEELVKMTPCLDDCLVMLSYDELTTLLAETPNDLLAHNADGPMANPAHTSAGAATLPPRRLPAKAAPAAARPAAPAPAAAKAAPRPAAKAAPRPAALEPDPPADDDMYGAEDPNAVYADTSDVPFDDEAAVVGGDEAVWEEVEAVWDEASQQYVYPEVEAEPEPEPEPTPPPRPAKAAPRPAKAAPRPAAPAAAKAAPRPAAPAKAAPRPAAPAPAAARPAAPAKAAPRPAGPAQAPAAAKAAPRPAAPAKAAPRPAKAAPRPAAPAPAEDSDFGWPTE